MKNKKIIWGIIVIVVVVAIILIFSRGSGETNTVITGELAGNWINIELSDIRTGEKFKISDFNDRPVLLESFAVWCPTCTRQQQEVKKLHEELGDSFVSISIDTDPNEDRTLIKEHKEKNGFDWIYVVAPKEFTQSLIDQFGFGIVNAPAAPMILICGDGTLRQLDSGLKRVNELKEELSRGC